MSPNERDLVINQELRATFIAAREHYREHGGALDGYLDREGRTDVITSLVSVTGVHYPEAVQQLAKYLPISHDSEFALAALENYNDRFEKLEKRRAKILALFDAAIKDLENK